MTHRWSKYQLRWLAVAFVVTFWAIVLLWISSILT